MRYTLFIYIVLFVLGWQNAQAQTETKSIADMTAEELVTETRNRLIVGDPEGSFQYIDKALEMRTFCTPFSPEAWAEVVALKGVAYSQKFDWQKAIKVGLDAYTMLKSQPRGYQYAETLYHLATFYAGRGMNGDIEKALSYALQAKDFFSRKTPEAFACGNDLAYYYMLMGNDKEAQAMAKAAIKTGEDIFGDNPAELIRQLWGKAEDMAELESYDMAITYAMASIAEMEKTGRADTIDYVRKLIKVAGYYFQKRDFRDEALVLEKTIPVANRLQGDDGHEYIASLRKAALAYNHLANELRGQKKAKEEFDECLLLSEKYENISRESLIRTNRLDEIRVEQLPLVSNSALRCYNEGKIDEALKYEKIAHLLTGKYRDTLGLANSCSNLTVFYHKLGDRDSMAHYAAQAIALYDGVDTLTRNRQLAYNNIAFYMHEMGKKDDALRYGLKAVQILREMGDTISDGYTKALTNVSVYYNALGDETNASLYSQLTNAARDAYEEAEMAKMTEAERAAAKKKKKKKNDDAVAPVKAARVDNNMITLEWNRAVYAANEVILHDSYRKAFDLQRRLILQDFPGMSVEERVAQWDKQKFISEYATTIAFSYAFDDSLVIDAFDALMMSENMDTYIRTENSSVISQSWKDIASSIPDGTVYVKFFATPTDNDFVPYSAFIIKNNWTAPRVARQVFLDKHIYTISYDSGATTALELLQSPEGKARVMADYRVGTTVWETVLQALDTETDIKAIRYVTDGILKELDPGVMYLTPEQKISDKYRMEK